MIDAAFLSEFERWVANAVQEVSGIPREYLRSDPSKRALTCVEIRMVACQPLGEPVANQHKQALARSNCKVVTNQVQRFKKLP